MTIIDGINVAILECDDCKSKEFYIFRGQNGEGYKIACVKCHKDQRDLVNELKIPYLWKHLEVDSDIEL